MNVSIPDELAAHIAAIAQEAGQITEWQIVEMLSEGIKMRRVPGILFADGATGRRARVGGTGIDVFEVIDLYELVGRDRKKVQEHLPQLQAFQINAAIAYYEEYPDEIWRWLKSDEQVQAELEALWVKIPQASPQWESRQRRTVGS